MKFDVMDSNPSTESGVDALKSDDPVAVPCEVLVVNNQTSIDIANSSTELGVNNSVDRSDSLLVPDNELFWLTSPETSEKLPVVETVAELNIGVIDTFVANTLTKWGLANYISSFACKQSDE